MTREEMLACVEREIRMRERVYPEWTKLGRMSAQKAAHELAAMRAVRDVIAALPVVPAPQAELFPPSEAR